MKPKTRLDSAIFQLTPTRTRCDLYIIANDKKEKIASGLLNPFLAHLKTAQDQIAKGGYSVLLEPEPGSNPTWFTKGIVESFVRFVSTPEILERVHTIESEILQIEEAIAMQCNNDSRTEDHPVKPVTSNEGHKPISDADEEKAIVLYKPGAQPIATDGSKAQEGNSKVELLKVLEARKMVLQKEQGMAFARAVAAGFEIDHMANLMSFAECFGALRLMDACLRFMDLWKRKHESGQWLEIEAVDAVSSKSDFSPMNASGIVLSSMASRHNESRSEVPSETNEKTGSDTNAAGQQEHFPGQFPHPVFPPWAMHSSPGALPVYQGYPMPGMPYYQNYPGNGQFYPPPYPSMEDPRVKPGDSNTRSQSDEERENEEDSRSSERHKKAGKSGKKQSGMVVIRNINYITSKRQNSSGDESESTSDSDTSVETANDMHKNSSRSSKKKSSQEKSETKSDLHGGRETDGGNWQAFQSYLLQGADDDNRSANDGIFAMERDPQIKRRQKSMVDDPLVHPGRDVETHDRGRHEFQEDGASLSQLRRASHDDVLITKLKGEYVDGGSRIDMQSYETIGRKIVYRSANDDFIVSGRDQANLRSASDPLAENGFEGANLDRSGLNGTDDATFIAPFRSMSLDQGVNDSRAAIDMDYELPSRNPEHKSNKIDTQVNYEPHDLSLMPERGLEKSSVGYDPALDYEMQLTEDAALRETNNKQSSSDVKQGPKSAEKDQKTKANQGTLDKKKTVGPVRKGKPAKMNPLEDARARAEKLRSYKADLQKMKKEQQDAEHRRLEALKMERQKRIAARANSMSGQSTLPVRKQLPSKLSPISHRGSKFSDSEPGSSSPLQRSKIRTPSIGSSNSKKPSTSNKSIDGSHLAGNRLTRSVSSLSDTKKELNPVTPDPMASMARIRRLSEPKKINNHTPISVKPRSAEPSKPKLSNGPESKTSKPKVSNGPESKKISAIMNLDRSKAATLPELKIKTSKGSLNGGQKNSAANGMTVKEKEDKPPIIHEAAETNLGNERLSHQRDVDDSPVIEKTVVMLELEQPSISTADASEESIRLTKGYDGNQGMGENIKEDYAAIRAVPSSMDTVVDKQPVSIQSLEHPGSYELRKHSVEELPKDQSAISAEKPYQAPYARVSSMEDQSTRNSEYGKAPQTNFDMGSSGLGTGKAYVSDLNNLKLEKIPEVLEKPHAKEAKGFRRLLKLGKKSHSISDTVSMTGSEPDDITSNTAASGEVNTLKNLISQDETPTASNTTQKSSRHFSLLSPFRSKTSEKKLAQ